MDKGSSYAWLKWGSCPRWASLRVVGPDIWPLTHRLRVVVDDAVVGGGAVCLSLLTFLALGDDDGASISPDVDDVAEIVVGVVVRLSNIFL